MAQDSESVRLRNELGFIDSENPLQVEIGDGAEQADIIPTNGQNALVTMSPGHVSTDNSTATFLNGDETFTGEWEEITNTGVIMVILHSDQVSATDGLVIEFSADQTSMDTTDEYTYLVANIGKTYSFQAAAKWFRIKYTNGSTIQTHFHLQTILKPYYVKPSSHRVADMISGQDDAELIKSVITYQSTGTDDFKNIGVQVPLPVDGDSVYEKDINITKSDNGSFSGDVIDYFNSLNSVNNDASATNPKVIKVWLKRTAYASSLGLGCDDLSKTFSNIKLELFGSGEVIRNTIDESSDSTKRNSFLFEFAPTAFNGFFLSFHTADEIGLSNITVAKEIQVVARLKAVKPDGVVTDIDATMGGNLKVSIEEFDPAADPVRRDMEGLGKLGIGTTATEVVFTGTPTFSVIIRADRNNTGLLFIGESNVTNLGANSITYLEAGDSVTIDYDDVDNAVYVVASVASQNFYAGALL